MDLYRLKIQAVAPVTHDVQVFTIEKPEGFTYEPGQATELSLIKDGWEEEKRPFTFTSLPSEDTLQFTIKSYMDHEGVTKQLALAKAGDEVEIGDAWGTIQYKGEGIFIAGGAGVTPFIAILRQLHQQGKIGSNKLFFSNKTEQDIILREEFEQMLGAHFVNIISKDQSSSHYREKIDKRFLEEQVFNFDQPFYVCGPEPFQDVMMDALKELGADPEGLVFEK